MKKVAETIATIDLKFIHKISLQIKKIYPKYCHRFLFFLVACQYFDPDIDFEAKLKLRPYRGLYLSTLECFQMYHVVTTENEKTDTNPFTYAQVVSTSSSAPGR